MESFTYGFCDFPEVTEAWPSQTRFPTSQVVTTSSARNETTWGFKDSCVGWFMEAVDSLTCHVFCIMLPEMEILWDWHLIKGSFQSIFWSGVWNWRSLIRVCEICRSAVLLQGSWQSWSAVTQRQQKQIYNIMQSEDGELPQATHSLSPPSHFAQMYFLSYGNWLTNIQLIGGSLNFSPCKR